MQALENVESGLFSLPQNLDGVFFIGFHLGEANIKFCRRETD